MKPRVSLLIRDFKDRRNAQQRRSYAGIPALHQARLDREITAKWRLNVARNERERALGIHRIGVAVLNDLPVKHLHDDDFIPEFLRAREA